MIELTVKTLDSQNHAFTVDDDMTVAQFKEKIADTVNIPADTQRIIYCGRVLQDSSKLIDYDVNGKVVHLVQRPPPSANQRPNQPSESPPAQPQLHRRIRGLEYLGSLRLPTNATDQNVMPPLPTHSLAASRLNIARRMLRRAEAVLGTLENPSARPADQPTQEGQAEITPVFEARVIVPNIPSNESLNEAAVISAVNSLMNSALPLNGTQTTASPNVQVQLTDSLPQSTNDPDAVHSVSSTPEVISPLATSSENLTAQDEEQGNGTSNEDEPTTTTNGNNTTNSANNSNETISRTSEYAELLDNLNRIHSRFTPFLEEYYNFMRDDPTVPSENARTVQGMINRVSEILHLLGHAYHSLSDIIVRVRTPPPRPLLCRPILIQHSAIVQAGIPIQVEAQINFSSDRNGNANRAPTTQSYTINGNQINTTTTTAGNIGPTITAQLPPRVGFPLIPGAGVRVETYHIPQTANMSMENLSATTNNNNRDVPIATPNIPNPVQVAASNNNSSSNNGTGLSFGTAIPGGEPTTIDPTNVSNVFITSNLVNNIGGNSTSEATQQVTNSTTSTTPQVTINNPVEFFMEVTPESITIDSLETAFVGSNQANEILQGALNPPPELIQSIMHMAGQLINRGAQSATMVSASAAPSAPQSEGPANDAQTPVTTNGGAARVIPFQNSQARGNTQTQPTTATHTRSTARPHVHLAQHAMQGFDPFLPCNSHHVTRRRVPQTATAPQTAQPGQGNATTAQANGEGANEARNADQANPLYNIMRSIINTVHHAYTNQQTTPQTPAANATTTAPNSATAPAPSITPPWMPTLENMNLSDTSFLRTPAPTIAQLLQQFPDESYTEGESIFTDLIMLLSRNLTISDVIQINSGRLEPLMRIRNQLRNFFLYRILDGCQGTAAIDRGVDRLLTELQPLLDHLAGLETRDDIDIVRSVQTLLRARLPNIIALVASRSPNSLKMVVDQIRTTGRQFCALAVRASQNGRQGVENIFDLILSRYMEGIPRDLQQWTLMTSRAHMMLVLSSLDVPESILQPYIVREVDAITPSIVNEPVALQDSNASGQVESMQVDEEAEIVSSSPPEEQSLPAINLAEDPEPLPQVVYGSETWHREVPSEWVPIIARDSQRQRRQNSQPPFSDAYLSGMPSKRRKIVTNSKPQGSLPQVITDSVRHAVTATGLTGVAPLETVAAGAGADLNIQSAYRNLLRSSVQSGLSNNADFTPERFPNANNYFNNYPQ